MSFRGDRARFLEWYRLSGSFVQGIVGIREEKPGTSRRADNAERHPGHSITPASTAHRLPAARNVLVLHLSAWRDGHWRARNRSGRGVDNRDCIARPLRHRLVQLHVLLLLEGRGVVRIRYRGEKKRRSRLDLLLERRAFGRT